MDGAVKYLLAALLLLSGGCAHGSVVVYPKCPATIKVRAQFPDCARAIPINVSLDVCGKWHWRDVTLPAQCRFYTADGTPVTVIVDKDVEKYPQIDLTRYDWLRGENLP